MLINWNHYAIDLSYNGSDFSAKRLDDDKRWKRIYEGRWHNEFCANEHDTELIAVLEQGVRDWQALHAPKPRPRQRGTFNGHIRSMQREPIAPPVRGREWKGEARS